MRKSFVCSKGLLSRGILWFVIAAFAIFVYNKPAIAQSNDTIPPTLVSIDITPSFIDVSSGNQEITLTMHITDDVSGLDYATITIHSPDVNLPVLEGYGITIYDKHRVSGSAQDGIYKIALTVGPSSIRGLWYYQPVTLYDFAEKERRYCDVCPSPFPGDMSRAFFIGPPFPRSVYLPLIR